MTCRVFNKKSTIKTVPKTEVLAKVARGSLAVSAKTAKNVIKQEPVIYFFYTKVEKFDGRPFLALPFMHCMPPNKVIKNPFLLLSLSIIYPLSDDILSSGDCHQSDKEIKKCLVDAYSLTDEQFLIEASKE